MKTPFTKINSRIFAMLCVIALAFSLTACTPNTPPPEEEVFYFILPLENEYMLVDTNGNEIMRASWLEYLPRYSAENIEYIVAGDTSTFYNVVIVQPTALYSINGTLLFEAVECKYLYAFGNFVIRTNIPEEVFTAGEEYDAEEMFSELINVETGEVLYSDILSASVIDENLVALFNVDYTLHSLVDLEGNHISNVISDKPIYSISKHEDYYIVSTHEYGYTYIILDAEFNPIGEEVRLGEFHRIGQVSAGFPYMGIRDYGGALTSVIDITTGEEVFTAPAMIGYYGNFYTAFAEEIYYDMNATLFNIDGTELATFPISTFIYIPAEGDAPARFYYADIKTGDIVCMSETGEILLQKHLADDVYIISLSGNGLLEITNSIQNENGFINKRALLVDLNLDDIVDNRHEYIHFANSQMFNGIIAASYSLIDDNYEYEMFVVAIYTADGEFIMENLLDVYMCRNGFVAVRHIDGYVGIMDTQGNWLCKFNYTTGEAIA